MKLNNEFTVDAPLDRTWETLLDVERVGSCLPGATMEPADAEGVYRGRMKMKLGPMAMAYEGSARLVEVDEDEHATVMDVKGREAKGQGTAAATIRNWLEEAEGGRTRVRVETDLQVTGRQAQFGRGIMEDVAGRMLGQFASQLEQMINAGDGDGAAAPADAGGPAESSATAQRLAPDSGDDGPGAARTGSAGDDDEVLDVGSVLSGSLTRNLPIVGGVLALVLVLVLAARTARRPNRAIRFELRL